MPSADPTDPTDRSSACHCADTWLRNRRKSAASRCGSTATPFPAVSTRCTPRPGSGFPQTPPGRNAAPAPGRFRSSARSTRAMPTLEPCEPGFTNTGRPRVSTAVSRSCDSRSTTNARWERPRPGTVAWYAACPCRWPNPYPAARIGNAEELQRALHGAVLATRAVERNPDPVDLEREQIRQRALRGIEADHVESAPLEPREHGFAADQGDLTLARCAAQQHRHAAETALPSRCGVCRERRTAAASAFHHRGPALADDAYFVSSATPCAFRTVRSTWRITCSSSLAVA